MDAIIGGGGQSSPLPPPMEKIDVFFLMGGFFFHVGTFLPIFCYFFSMCMGGGGGLSGLAPPLYENFCGRPCSGVVGNFSLSWHYGHISYRFRARGGGVLE